MTGNPGVETPSPQRYIEKELSWLSFNERVLQEAADESVPIIQRLRYLGIFSNNQDEFFRVRVADVSRLAAFSSPVKQEPYNQLLQAIQHKVVQLQNRFDRVYLAVLRELRRRHIYLINEQQLEDKQRQFVTHYFYSKVLPELVPVMLDDFGRFPDMDDGSIYLAVKLVHNQQVRYALVEVPSKRLDRFVEIPQRKGKRGKVFIVLENIIRQCLVEVFRGALPIDSASAYTIKLTRDAELELGEGISQSLIDKVSSSLKKRRNADPVRFVYDSEMPEDLMDFFTRRLNLGKYDSLLPGGRYHNAKDFMNFPDVGPSYLEFKPLPPIRLPEFHVPGQSLFDAIRQQDVLLYYPYNSFNYITDLLHTAAIDPAVKSIYVSLYRVAAHSRIASALLNAVRNRKEVTAVVELQARFDEAANIDWARQLTEGGVNVIFGIPGLKVHGKLILIGRQENNVTRYYSHLGTGNLNEKTARVYTDFSLLTYNQEIGQDVANVFDFIQYTYRRYEYKHLLVSPHSNRSGLERLIRREIDNAKAGLDAAIDIKCNNLVDQGIIELLYEASTAGVEIRLIVRGMCGLIANQPGLSDNIQAISIVDRYLEHPRVYIFHNNGQREYFISSADLMTRNLDFRVEVTCPIYDPRLRQQLQDIFDLQWCDNVKARALDASQSNNPHVSPCATTLQAQEVIHDYLRTGKMPKQVLQARKRGWRVAGSKKKKKHKSAK